MSRDLPAPLRGKIESPVLAPFFAVHIDLPDPVITWTGVGDIIFPDNDAVTQTWVGTGGVGSLDVIGESTDGSATGFKVSLNQIPSEFRDDIADQATRGADFKVYFGALDEDMQTVIGSKMIGRAKVDEYRVTDGGDTLAVEITGESRSIDQGRASIKRFTDEYQQRRHPGDLFFQYNSQMVEVQVLWAAASQNSTATGGGGSGGYGGGGGGGGDARVAYY